MSKSTVSVPVSQVSALLQAMLEAKSFKKEDCFFLAKLANGVSKLNWELTPKQLEASKKLLEEKYQSSIKDFLKGKALQQDANYIAPVKKEPKAPKAPKSQKQEPKAPELADVLTLILKRLDALEKRGKKA